MDTVSKARRSQIMAQVRSQGNRSTELRMIRLFREAGIVGWRRKFPLQGKPDFIFPMQRVAVFVDGCFWHGCRRHCRLPGARRRYWTVKIKTNITRDKETNRFLKGAGWIVIRFWEHELVGGKASQKIRRLKTIVHLDK